MKRLLPKPHCNSFAPRAKELHPIYRIQSPRFIAARFIIPLTAAFIDDNGRITNLADMQPGSEDNLCSTQPVRYVLEMNQGWFAKRHIRAGHTVRGLPAAQ